MKYLSLILSILLIMVQFAFSQVPQRTSFQGLLTDSEGAVVADGDHSLNLKLYDSAANGTMLWEETQTVSTVGGVFNVILGEVSILNLPFDKPYWLEMTIDGGEALLPRVELTSSFYSLMSKSVEDSTISTVKLQDNSVTTEKLSDGAVTQEKLSGSVSLPPGGTAGGDLVGSYPNPSIANDAVNSAKVADNSITQEDVLPDMVSSIDGVSNDGGNVDLVEGSNVTITPNDETNTITISAATGAGDNLGNHTASQNIKLNNKWLTNDEGDEGIKIDNSGKVQTNSDITVGDNIVAHGYISSNNYIEATHSSTADNTNAVYGIISSTSPGSYSVGVRGENKGTGGQGIGVHGSQDGGGWGVYGEATSGRGVYGKSASGYGVLGQSTSSGGYGVAGQSSSGYAVFGTSTYGYAGFFAGKVSMIGNVGIGTISPDDDLHVADHIRIGEDPSYPLVYGELIHDGGGTGFKINAHAGGGGWADMHFQTNATTKMFLESGGNVGIGTISPGYLLEVNGSAGKPGGGSWSNSSDIRLKNIHGNYKRGLKEIIQLKPVSFRYKENNTRNLPTDTDEIGFIAQDVQKVFPEAVNEGADGYLDFNMHSINVAVVNAIRELKTENDILNEKINRLERLLAEVIKTEGSIRIVKTDK